jgi:hypothetical protein
MALGIEQRLRDHPFDRTDARHDDAPSPALAQCRVASRNFVTDCLTTDVTAFGDMGQLTHVGVGLLSSLTSLWTACSRHSLTRFCNV